MISDGIGLRGYITLQYTNRNNAPQVITNYKQVTYKCVLLLISDINYC